MKNLMLLFVLSNSRKIISRFALPIPLTPKGESALNREVIFLAFLTLLYTPLFLFGQETQQAQIVVKDAIELAQLVEDDYFINNSVFLEILGNYAPPKIREDTKKLTAYFEDQNESPYLHLYMPQTRNLRDDGEGKARTRVGSALSAIGGLDVTFFADGLAKFFVDRLKRELTAEYLNKFKRTLNDERYKDLRTLFPRTHQILNALDFSNYMVFIEAIREAFYLDYKDMFLHLAELSANHKEWLATHPELGASLELAIALIRALKAEVHPGNILLDFAQNFQVETIHPVLAESLQAANAISQSLRVSSDDRYWADEMVLRELFTRKHAFPIYLGLLYQQLKENDISIDGFSLKDQLAKLEGNYVEVLPVFKGLANRFIRTESLIKEISQTPAEERTFENYFSFITSVTDIFDFGTDSLNWAKFGITISPAPNQAIQRFIGISNTTNSIYFDLQAENYSAAVLNINDILEEVFGSDYSIQEAFLKYGFFTAAIIKAESSEEVKNLIESIALPPGSYRMKRESKFSVDLNGYIGGTYGLEMLHLTSTADGSNTSEFKNILGISAPVGLSLSTGFDPSSKMSGSLFLSLLDVGALASFRLQDSLTEVLPKIKLENIFAPGAHFILGLPRTGISFGAGVQLGPFLREIALENAALTTKVMPNYRLALTLTYDIPILNLKNTQNESAVDKQLRKIEEEERKLARMKEKLRRRN